MKTMIVFLTCIFIVGCASKSKQKVEGASEASINNTVEKNDTLELLSDNQQEVTIKESEKQEQLSGTMTYKLKPIPRDIPTGQAINSDSLSMRTEYDYYPLSTTKIKVIITNLSHHEYECGESYSLAYFDEQRNTWETLPTNPIINNILCYGFLYQKTQPMSRRLNSIPPKSLIDRANIVFTRLSIEKRKSLMRNLSWLIRKELKGFVNELTIIGEKTEWSPTIPQRKTFIQPGFKMMIRFTWA